MLAAAQLQRADAGLEDYPRLPFGTRVMIVTTPKPKNKFAPRAMPGTVFGPASHISGALWTYQNGVTKARVNLQTSGMTEGDLQWVKIELPNWDCPDAPVPAPPAEQFDAAAVYPVHDVPVGATRETVKCVKCIAEKHKKRSEDPHSLVWGECLQAHPPPPEIDTGPTGSVEQPVTRVPDEDPSDEEEVAEEPPDEEQSIADVAAKVVTKQVRFKSTRNTPLWEFPHACMALSDISEAATYGGSAATDTSDDLTSIPADEVDPEYFIVDDDFFDEEEFAIETVSLLPENNDDYLDYVADVALQESSLFNEPDTSLEDEEQVRAWKLHRRRRRRRWTPSARRSPRR